ncbi:MAG: hypothetical protein U9N49_11920 [Campylobacterota bacterium]|nr:hypothetical protein [Campylobacterota bacterium]
MDYAIISIFVFLALFKINSNFQRKKRRNYIKAYQFQSIIKKRLLKTYPHLSNDNIDLVFKALRDYFLFSFNSKNMLLAMPSQVLDVAWHEFILTTREYSQFCNKAFGKYLHHTPTEVMISKQKAQKSIQDIWRVACQKEGINPTYPSSLPLLFAIDGILNIEDGYKYALNCDPTKREYCASHITCSSGDGDGGYTGGYHKESSDDSGCGGD